MSGSVKEIKGCDGMNLELSDPQLNSIRQITNPDIGLLVLHLLGENVQFVLRKRAQVCGQALWSTQIRKGQRVAPPTRIWIDLGRPGNIGRILRGIPTV